MQNRRLTHDVQQELIRVIGRTVQPNNWAFNGGRGTIEFFGDRMTVMATPECHEQIGRLLEQLRARAKLTW